MGSKDNDMFAGIRNESSEGSLFGPAMMAILCGALCFCLFLGIFVAFFVWAIVTLVVSAPSKETECGRQHYMWEYCITVVIAMPILGIIFNAILAATKMPGLAVIPGIISVAITIWGIVLWSQLGECDSYYSHSQPDLFLLFKIYVVLFIVLYGLAGCCMVCHHPRISAELPAPNSTFRSFP